MKMLGKTKMGKKYTWPRDSEIMLITEVRERPQLWDPSHPDYSKAHKKSAQWEEIAEKLGTCFDATMVKDRFDNMRTTFQRNHNKVKDSIRSGKGTDDIFEPKWDLYHLLMFLKRSCAQANSTSNLGMRNDFAVDSHLTRTDTDPSIVFLETDRDVYFDETLQQWALIPKDSQPNEKCPDDSESIVLTQQSSSPQIIHPKSSLIPPKSTLELECFSDSSVGSTNTKRSISNEGNDELFVKRGKKSSSGKPGVMEEAFAAIKQLSSEPPPSVQMDAYDHFGAYIAARLRAMDTEQEGKAKLEIMKILI